MKRGILITALGAGVALAQTVPAPVPESEVFSPEQIGHALAAPTPQAGHTAPSAANAPPDDGQWTMPAKNYASTRFSELDEINEQNVKNLQVAFTFSLGVNRGQEAAPLGYRGPYLSDPVTAPQRGVQRLSKVSHGAASCATPG